MAETVAIRTAQMVSSARPAEVSHPSHRLCGREQLSVGASVTATTTTPSRTAGTATPTTGGRRPSCARCSTAT